MESVARDPETGNIIGTDNDVTSFLCDGLECGSFHLRYSMNFEGEYYYEDEKKWSGAIGEVINETATFRIAIYFPPRNADHDYAETSYTSFIYVNEEGFSIGYPAPKFSNFDIVMAFE